MHHIKWLLLFMFIPVLFFAYKYFEKQQNNPLNQQLDAHDHVFKNQQNNPLYQQLDAYAQAFKLMQLRSSNKNELRLWVFDPMDGGISSLIITDNGVSECEGTSQFGSNTEIIVKSSSCRKSKNQLLKSGLESTLVKFRELKEMKTSCDDAVDGWSITIDGVLNNERFAFEAWNPNVCESPGAKKLTDLLESI
jgi:hypothetical protein